MGETGSAKKNDLKTFMIEFLMGSVSAAICKTIAAHIQLSHFRRWLAAEEYITALWKDNATNVLRYFPTQALNFSY